MCFDTWSDVIGVLVVGTAAYLTLARILPNSSVSWAGGTAGLRALAVLETDGTPGVIPRGRFGGGRALEEVAKRRG